MVFLNGLTGDTVFGNVIRIRTSQSKNLSTAEKRIKTEWIARNSKKAKENGTLKTDVDFLNMVKKMR